MTLKITTCKQTIICVLLLLYLQRMDDRRFVPDALQYAKLAIALRAPGGGKKKKAPAAPQGGASGAPAAGEEDDDYDGGLC